MNFIICIKGLMMEKFMLMLSFLCFIFVENFAFPAEDLSIPKSVTISENEKLLFTTTAIGVQIYECKKDDNSQYKWVFKEPRADLYKDGRIVGKHYAGPTWEYEDKSLIVGKLLSKYENLVLKSSIPWLKLKVISHKNPGALTPVSAIQRLNTSGGGFSGACKNAGELYEQPYKAEYVFLTNK